MSNIPRSTGGGLYHPRGHNRKKRWPVAIEGGAPHQRQYKALPDRNGKDGSSLSSPTLSSTTQDNPYSSSSSSSKQCSVAELPEPRSVHSASSSSPHCSSGSVKPAFLGNHHANETRSSSREATPALSACEQAMTLAIPRGYLSIKDVVKCSGMVCSRWRWLGEKKWLKLAVCHCAVGDGEERRWFWMEYCGHARDLPLLRDFDGDYQKCYDYYLGLHDGCSSSSSHDSELAHEIARDVRRTLPTHEIFVKDEGQIHAKLQSVLMAIANASPTIGYCQGMNFIVAVLLIHLDLNPANAFVMMQCLLDNYQYRYLFSPGVPLLPLRMRQFSCVARKNLPGLWHHLNSHSFTVDVFAQQWVMTLFGYYVDADFLKYVYDLFFLCGWKAVFKTGMAILTALEPKLLKMNMEEISRYMQNSKHGTDFMRADSEAGKRLAQGRAMFKILDGCKVTNRDLVEYAGEFQTSRLLEAVKNIPGHLLEECKPEVPSEAASSAEDFSSSSRSLRERFNEGLSSIQGAIMRRSNTNGEAGEQGSRRTSEHRDSNVLVDEPIPLGVIGFSIEPPGDLVIDTNALITKNKPLWREKQQVRESPGTSSLRVPLRQVCELKYAIKDRNAQLGQDMTVLTSRLSSFEVHKLLPAEKHRDDLATARDRALARYHMLQQRKLVLSAKLQGRAREAVNPDSPGPLMAAADLSPFSRTIPMANLTQRRGSTGSTGRKESLSDLGLLGVPPSPEGARRHDSSTVDDIGENEPLPRTLDRVIQVERECHSAKEALSEKNKEYTAALHECRELEEVKKRYVEQTTQFMTDMEVTIQELVWSSIGGSAYRPRQLSPTRGH